MKKSPAAEETNFEQAIERLEEIVAELDRGDLALEEALKLFQEGTALREVCERKLTEAEATVEQLLERASTDGSAPTADAALETRAPDGDAALESRTPTADSLFGDDDE